MSIGVGVAIEPDALQGVVLERSGSRVKLVAAQEFPCETSNPDTLTNVLTQLRKAFRVATPVVVGLPSTFAMLTTINALIVNSQRAAFAVAFELQQHLPFPLSDAVWHHYWLSLVNGNGHRTDARFHTSKAVVAAVRQSLLQERLACCRRAGLSVLAVTVNAVAALTVWQKSRSGGLAVPSSGKGRAAQAKQAGESTAMTLLRLSGACAAEWIVRTQDGLEVMPITGASPETWWQELAASWEAFSGSETPKPTPVWLAGSPAALSSLQRAGLVATRLEPGQLVDGPSALMERLDRAAAAMGLALHGAGETMLPLNLLAVSQEEERSRQVHRMSAVVTGCCLLATLGLGVGGMMELRRQRLLVLQALERREHLYLTLRPEVRSIVQRQQHTERRNNQLEQLITNEMVLPRMLAQVTGTMPEGIWLTLLDCSKGAAGPAAQPGSGDLMTGTLEGHSASFQDVTQFMDRLKSGAEMSTVKPLSTNVITDQVSGKEAIGFAVQIQRLLPAPAPAVPSASSSASVAPEKAAPTPAVKTPTTTATSSASSKKKSKRIGPVKR